MIVVGGRDSANTRHLAVVARECGVETYHIETADEIDAAWLAGHDKVGVTAGASTPDFVIDRGRRPPGAAGSKPLTPAKNPYVRSLSNVV